MPRKYVCHNINPRYGIFGDVRYEDDEEEKYLNQVIEDDINDINNLIDEIGYLDEESKNDWKNERKNDSEGLAGKKLDVDNIYSYMDLDLGFIGLFFFTNLFLFLYYSLEYDKWKETNEKYLLTWK